MTQEEKDLVIKDLCARLPYGVKVEVCVKDKNIKSVDCVKYDTVCTYIRLMDDENFSIKPYLRPMSSMTEEEKDECLNEYYKDWKGETIKEGNMHDIGCVTIAFYSHIDWLNAHHFDYRGLIPMGLALEAPEGMYN